MILESAPSSVLAVYAHPDDADISCGGTLATWASKGVQCDLLVCTPGDKGSTDSTSSPADLIVRRSAEIDASASALGLSAVHRFDVPDGEIENTIDFRGQLVELLRRVRPEAVIFPDPTAVFFGNSYVNHRDHRELGWAMLDILGPVLASPHYYPESGEPQALSEALLSGTLEPDCWVNVAEGLDAKVEAVASHVSQLGEHSEGLAELVKSRAATEGRSVGLSAAEAFRRLTFS